MTYGVRYELFLNFMSMLSRSRIPMLMRSVTTAFAKPAHPPADRRYELSRNKTSGSCYHFLWQWGLEWMRVPVGMRLITLAEYAADARDVTAA